MCLSSALAIDFRLTSPAFRAHGGEDTTTDSVARDLSSEALAQFQALRATNALKASLITSFSKSCIPIYKVSAIARSTFLSPGLCNLVALYADTLPVHLLDVSSNHLSYLFTFYRALKRNNDKSIQRCIERGRSLPFSSVLCEISERINNIQFMRGLAVEARDIGREVMCQAILELHYEARSMNLAIIFENAYLPSPGHLLKMRRPILAPLLLVRSGIPQELHSGIESLKGNVETLEEARIVLLIETSHFCSVLAANMRLFMKKCLQDQSIVLVEGVEKGNAPLIDYLSLLSQIEGSHERGICEMGWDDLISLRKFKQADTFEEMAPYAVGRNLSLISTIQQFPNKKIYIDLGLGHAYDPFLLHALHKEKVMLVTFKSFKDSE